MEPPCLILQLYNMYPVIHPLPGPHHKVLAYQDNLKAFFRKSFIQHRQILDENDSRSYIDAFLKKQQEVNPGVNVSHTNYGSKCIFVLGNPF